jgi:hypothetical protein
VSTKDTPHGRGMAWATLLVSGGISLGVNLWHAFDKAPDDRVTWWFGSLAVLYGTAPVVLAAFQSHSAAFVPMRRVKRGLTYVLVLLGMVLSVQAQAAAVAVFAGDWLKWVFPVLVDLSAFLALHTLMSSPARAARKEEAPSPTVREQQPVRGEAPEPVRPVMAPAVPPAPLERSAPSVPVPVPAAAPVQTTAPDRTVPAARTAPVPAKQTTPEPVVRPASDHPGTADLTSAKAGDAAALERMDRAFAGMAPDAVSVRQVRKELGAGHARADRLLAVWVARTGGTDRGTDQPGTDGVDRAGGGEADQEGEADRTANRVTVPA